MSANGTPQPPEELRLPGAIVVGYWPNPRECPLANDVASFDWKYVQAYEQYTRERGAAPPELHGLPGPDGAAFFVRNERGVAILLPGDLMLIAEAKQSTWHPYRLGIQARRRPYPIPLALGTEQIRAIWLTTFEPPATAH